MARRGCGFCVLGSTLLLLSTATSLAAQTSPPSPPSETPPPAPVQQPGTLPPPAPVQPPGTLPPQNPVPPTAAIPGLPQATVPYQPGAVVPTPVPFPSNQVPVRPYDPFFAPRFRKPGFFASLELAVVQPQIHSSLAAPVLVNGLPRNVSVPFTNQDWTGSPRLELGYRFPEGAGSLVAAYRSVVSQGTANLYGFDPKGPAFLRSRLNMNIVDVGYASPEMPFAPLWNFRWDLGARIGTVYYDSRAQGMVLNERVANNFVGAGPHVGLNVRRYFEAAPGFSLYGRLDGAVVVGNSTQSYERIRQTHFGTVSGASRFSDSNSVPVLGAQVGLSYAPPNDPHWFRFSLGYLFEEWFGVGNAGQSHGDVLFQGFFFRGEFNY